MLVNAKPSGMVTVWTRPLPRVSASRTRFHDVPGSNAYVPALRSRSRPRTDAYRPNSFGHEITPARSSESMAAPKLEPGGMLTRTVASFDELQAAVIDSAAKIGRA